MAAGRSILVNAEVKSVDFDGLLAGLAEKVCLSFSNFVSF
jgi:hypothetical protein